MAINLPNLQEIIERELQKRIQAEVYKEREKLIDALVKEFDEKIPSIVAELAVEISLRPEVLAMGNIVRFEISKK